ncbi:S-layer homology domain-containing protein [Actinomarinicola tropica]|uniref:S-layer homology domain-containing protein n=1 Tax=Actinomarinicola tropica TaxID=2789776 RepID=UPI001897FE15|nr:S-layer homology domain-containing protein [Actinomarinicola tropica]
MRRVLARACAALAVLAASVSSGGQTAGAQSIEMPDLPPGAPVFAPHQVPWNPTDEWIFPGVIRVDGALDAPLARYHLYTAPHDSPGGMSLFLADSLEGPWTPYPGNPVFPNGVNVSHTSTPHVIWVEDEQLFFMYFHGENDVTRLATSPDGITWTHEGVVVSAPSGSHAASYSRVFEHEIPRLGNRYVMLFTEERMGSGILRIRYAVSDDGRDWDVQPEVLVHPSGNEGTRISSATLLRWQGRNLVVYHGASGNIHVTDVGEQFDQEQHLGVLHDETDRVAAPHLLVEDGRLHMFYESGHRLAAVIRHTSAPVDELAPLGRHSGGPVTGYFTDVRPTSHHDDIYRLERAGLTTGCGTPTRFCPEDTITRAQMATFLSRALRLPVGSASRTTFDDVTTGTSYTAHIEALRTAGLTNGCGPDRFCPDGPVTRQEMATFLSRALELPPVHTNHFVDVAPGTSFTAHINAIRAAGITNGVGDGRFDPEGLVTRQQMASFLARAFDLR